VCQLFHRMASRPHSMRGGQSELDSDHVGRWSDWYTQRQAVKDIRELNSNPWKLSVQFSLFGWYPEPSVFVCLRALECWFVCVCQRGVKTSPPSAQLDRNSEASTPGLQLYKPKLPHIIHTHSILPLHDLYEIYTGCLICWGKTLARRYLQNHYC